MGKYRVYFRDWDRNIIGRDDFDAEDDRRATLVAWTLCDACSDRCVAYGLWQGERRVGGSFRMWRPDSAATTVDARIQNIVMEREIAVLESGWIVADSVRLLEQTARALLAPAASRAAPPEAPARPESAF